MNIFNRACTNLAADQGLAVSGSQEYYSGHEPATAIAESKLFRNIKGIIFDFDGTIFDNALFPFYLISAYPPDVIRIWKERLIRRQFAGCDYNSTEEYEQAFFNAFAKISISSPARIRYWYFNRYVPRMARTLKKHFKPRPGAVELFKRFDTGSTDKLKIAVYSDYPSLKDRLEALGIYPGADVFLYGPESFGAQKPAAQPFRIIAKDLGVAPEEVLVIGDREDTDGLGAFHAGMHFFCLETGRKRYHRLDPNRSPPAPQEPHGPSLVMYAGVWDDLVKALTENFFPDKTNSNTRLVK